MLNAIDCQTNFEGLDRFLSNLDPELKAKMTWAPMTRGVIAAVTCVFADWRAYREMQARFPDRDWSKEAYYPSRKTVAGYMAEVT